MAKPSLARADAAAKRSFDGQRAAGGATQPCPYTWIEIELVDKDNDPVPYEEYEVVLPDGTAIRGRLDARGFARVSGLHTSGQCQIGFPEIHGANWRRA